MLEGFRIEKVLDFFNYVYWFFIVNILFMIINIPVIFFFLFVGFSKAVTYLPFFLVCLIPTGPAFTSVLYCMAKLLRTKDLEPFKDFFHGLKINFKSSLLLWCLQLIFIFILSTNLRIVSYLNLSLIFVAIFAMLLLVNFMIMPYVYILTSRFSMGIKQTLKTSLILSITRPMLTIGYIASFLFVLMLFEISAGTTVLFISTVLSFLLIFMSKALLNQLELISQKNLNI
ncbi:DUF624 domain-containing protein [Clostridium tarantellae]|uniref:DUF624 domain-containing protein n=1 Tax=Clostridium tarantellae TaxID=39493 RepID=A0A6I1MPB1_9CLOT|nr:DUF624 domain-containing protein [Clostridium tarantellae]MPQ45265.1 DUF624 domain-containing protein [Clostridium tarantellae]